MGTIRKQAIYSSIVIYVGFLIGAINTWLFIKSGSGAFTPAQYGLTRLFFDVGQLMFTVASLGMLPAVYKFFPYYNDNLSTKENDLYTWGMVIPLLGFVLVIAGGLFFEPLIIRKFSEKSLLFVDYYHWVFLFGFGILVFTVFETYSNIFRRTVLPNFLKETTLRFLTLVLIVLFYFSVLNFDSFIKLFAVLYIIIAAVLGVILIKSKHFVFTFSLSRVTEKFKTKIATLASYIYGGTIILILSQVADSIMIASISEKGIIDAGVYSLAAYVANLIQVPQRSMIAITVPILSQAWKDKNMIEIDRIYKRTSINLLLIGLFIFGGIWLNINDAFQVLSIQKDYEAGLMVIFFLGIARLIDSGTGVNAQIIGTSTLWRFEFLTGVILLTLFLPLNYILIKQYGIVGSAYSNVIAFAVYNAIRLWFLWYKYKLQPFNTKTVMSLLLAVAAYFLCNYLFSSLSGWTGIILRSSLFAAIFIGGVFVLKLTPDALQLAGVLKNRFNKKT
jgi:O-antigen/teichoic acid export membrane protein